MAVKITYNGSQISSTSESGTINVTYNGSTIATMSAGQTKTVNCNGKYMLSNLVVGSKTLQCANKIMASNVGIQYEQSNISLSITNAGTTSTSTSYYGSYIRINGSTIVTSKGTYSYPDGTTVEIFVKSKKNSQSTTYYHKFSVNSTEENKYQSATATTYELACMFTLHSGMSAVQIALVNSSSGSEQTTNLNISTSDILVKSAGGGSTSTSSSLTGGYFTCNGTTYTAAICLFVSSGTQLPFYGKAGGALSTYYACVKLNGTEVGSRTTNKSSYSLLYTYTVSSATDISLSTSLTNRIMTITT